MSLSLSAERLCSRQFDFLKVNKQSTVPFVVGGYPEKVIEIQSRTIISDKHFLNEAKCITKHTPGLHN